MDSRLGAWLRAGLIVYTIAVVLLIAPLTSDPTGDSKTLLLHVAAALLGGALFAGRLTGRVALPARRLFLAPLLLFFAINVLAAAVSEYPRNSIPELTRLGALVLLYLVAAASMRTLRQVQMWMAAACVAVATSCVYALTQWGGLAPLPWDRAARGDGVDSLLTGTFGNVNYAGHAMVLCTVFAVFLAFQPRLRWMVAILGVYAISMGLSLQRGAIAALVCAAMVAAIGAAVTARVRGASRAVIATFATMLFALAAAVAALTTVVWLLGWGALQDNSLVLRSNAYAGAAAMIADRPLLGVGPGNYVIVNPEYWTRFEQEWFVQNRSMNQHVHCDILEMGADGGVPAAVLYLLLIIFASGYGLRHAAEFIHDTRQRRLGLAIAAFFMAFLVDGSFGFDYYVTVSSSFFFVLLGCADGLLTGGQPDRGTSRYHRIAAGFDIAAVAVIAWAGIRDYCGKALTFQARQAMADRDYLGADTLLERAERLRPHDWLVPYHRGAAAQLDRRIDQAREHFTRAVGKNSNYVPALSYLARLQLARAYERHTVAPAEAEAALRDAASLATRALQLVPDCPEELDILGRVYFLAAGAHIALSADDEATLWDKSYSHLTRAVERGLTPDAELWMILAQCAEAVGETERAERAHMKAVATLPAAEAPYAQYYRFAKSSGTLDTFSAVLASQLIHADAAPGRERAREWLDRSLGERTVDTERSWRIMLAAAQQSPGDASLWVALARETRTREQRQEFSDAVLALMEKTPSMPLAARVLAMSWSSERRALAGASKALIDALEAAPTPPPTATQEELSQLADLLEVQVREAAVDAPGAAVAAINLSRLRTKLGDPERGALVLGERYARMALPEQILAISHYAEALLAAQRDQEAETAVRDLAALAPTKAELRVLLARILARVGKAREAFDEYDVLLSISDLDAATRTLLESEQAALDIPKN